MNLHGQLAGEPIDLERPSGQRVALGLTEVIDRSLDTLDDLLLVVHLEARQRTANANTCINLTYTTLPLPCD